MTNHFEHRALNLNEKQKVIFIAMSKHSFYFRRHAVKFILEQKCAPISQFGIFDYFVTDSVNRDLVRKANNNLVRISDELWVFGPVSDGVLAEIKIVRKMKKPIKYFKIVNNKEVEEISREEVKLEDDVKEFSDEFYKF
jgi:hypothetical protein